MGRGGVRDAVQYGCYNGERIAVLPDEANSWPILRCSCVPEGQRWIPLHQPDQLLVCDPFSLAQCNRSSSVLG